MSAVVRELIQLGIATQNEDESVGIVFDDTKKKEEIIENKEGSKKLFLIHESLSAEGWRAEQSE